MFALLSGLFSLVSLVCAVMILISAFKNAIWKGIVGLICGLYLLYYGFTEYENPNKVMITLGLLISSILASTFRFMSMTHR